MEVTKTKLLKGAITTSFINGIINAAIQFFVLNDKTSIAISVDSITNTVQTVLGEAVVLSITLAMILTVISYFTIKEEKVKFFPNAFWLTIKLRCYSVLNNNILRKA